MPDLATIEADVDNLGVTPRERRVGPLTEQPEERSADPEIQARIVRELWKLLNAASKVH
jgi:hypothetical protein